MGYPSPARGFLRAFPLAGGEGPASCPLCRVLLLGQRCLPPTPIPADCQLVPLTRAGRGARTRCRRKPAGPRPVPLSTLFLRSAWLKRLRAAGLVAWGSSSLCAFPHSWAKQADTCVSPSPGFWLMTAFLPGKRKEKGNPGPARLPL